MSAHTVFSDDAQGVATKDRSATADMVLELAVRDAVRLIRLGRPGRAEFVMARAGTSADRIYGTKAVAS